MLTLCLSATLFLVFQDFHTKVPRAGLSMSYLGGKSWLSHPHMRECIRSSMSSASICAFHSGASGLLVPGRVDTVFVQVEFSQHTEWTW